MKKLLWVFVMAIGLNIFAQNTPILSNFRIENSNKDRVYFDASSDISGLTKQGFVVSGKIISSVNTSGKYFTVSSPFTFWDNNTIRLGENTDASDVNTILHNFTLSYIENNINEPITSTNKYVTTSASGGGNGNSEGTAWTLTEAFANATSGTTVWIKAGDYGNQSINVSTSGTPTSPIKFIGYKTTIGDITSNYYDYGVTWDSSEMPTLTGTSGSGEAITLSGANYIFFRNIQFTNFGFGIRANQSFNSYLIFDRLNGYNFGSGNDSHGSFIDLQTRGTDETVEGLKYRSNDHMKVLDCVGINSDMANFLFFGDGYSLFKNCKSYADKGTPTDITDYHIAVNGNNNIITNCHAENHIYAQYQGSWSGLYSHGIQIRGSHRLDNDYNLIANCTTASVLESFALRNYGCDYNVIKDCESTSNGSYGGLVTNGWHSGGIFLWGGVNNNIVERCIVKDQPYGIVFWDNNEENNYNGNEIGYNNIIRNCIISNVNWTVTFQGNSGPDSPLNDTKIINCTFYNNNYLLRDGTVDLTNFDFENCIFDGVGSNSLNENNGTLDSGISFHNSSFINNYNGWFVSGNGNIEENPNFIDTIDYVPQNAALKSSTPSIGVEHDIYEKERDDINSTIGAVEIYDNSTGSVKANAGEDKTICLGESVTLTASGGSTYSWSTGATTKSITVSPNTSTTYTVTVSDSGASDTDSVEVTVNTVTADAGSNKTINEGEQVTLTASGGGNYKWNTGATTQSITVNPTSTTTYSVAVTNNSCEDIDEVTVTVNSSTGSVTANAGEDKTICLGESVTLTASGGSTYSWNTGATTKSITVSPNTSTTYTVTVSEGGASDTDSVQVIVNTVTADAGSNKTINEGENVILTASGGDTYLWNTGAKSKSITVSPQQTINYSVTVYKNGCDDTDNVQVTVNQNDTSPPPAKADAGEDQTICLGESAKLTASGGATYLWGTGETTKSIDVNPIRTTTYTVKATRGGITDSDSIVITVENCSALSEGNKQDDFSVYPNPTNGIINIKTNNDYESLNLNIYSINGGIVYSDKIQNNNDASYKTLDLSSLTKGVYIVRLYNSDYHKTKKILLY